MTLIEMKAAKAAGCRTATEMAQWLKKLEQSS